MKRLVSFVLSVVFLLSIMHTGLLCFTASAATTASGSCGEGVVWVLEDGTLTISGNGAISNYEYDEVPWYANRYSIKSIIIQDGVTSIGDYAFHSCSRSTSVTIADSVKTIGNYAFYNCSYLTSITIPHNVTSIGEYAFRYCSNLAVVNFNAINCTKMGTPSGSGYIPVFGSNCVALKTVFVGCSVKSLPDLAFASCVNLESVYIPDDIKSIGSKAFNNCTKLIDVYYEGSTAEKALIRISSGNTYLENASWHYTDVAYHTFDDCYDRSCKLCDFTRDYDHFASDDCDNYCDICGELRDAPHNYDNCEDTVCNSCNQTRTAVEHIYSNYWDKICDVCGLIRSVGPFTITYHLDGGTNALKNPDVYTEEDTITLKNATKVGYNFVGWFLDANKTEQVTEVSLMGNVDLYAKFLPKSYNVTFDSKGAETSDQITITLHTNITSTKKSVVVNNGDSFSPYDYWQPKVSGYVFVGWMHNSELISNQIEITEDIDLYAKWVQNPNGYPVLGEDVTSISAYSDEKYFYISCNYTRIYYNLTAQKKYTEVLSPTTHLVQYTYSASSYSSITANGLNVSLPGYTTLKNGTWQEDGYATLAPGTLVRISNSRSGDLGNLSVAGGVTVEITGNTKHNNTITVSEKRTKTQVYDSVINAPSVSKIGYDFLGWYDSQGNQMTDTWRYTADQIFTAKWQPRGYELTYELDGGVNNASNPTVYTTEDTIILKDPSKRGHTFKGWYSDAGFTTQVTSISQKTGNITLYAKWEVNSYKLTLNANESGFAPKVTFISDGAEVEHYYLYSQDTISAYRPAGKDGHIFAGWYTDDAFTSLFEFNGTITNDITLYAKWVECNSNIVNVESAGSVNTTVQGKVEQLYAFVPMVDSKITVTSESNNLDMYGILYDANKNSLISADDISDMDLDFTYTYSVKAGQLYYIAVKGVTSSTAGQAVINIAWTGDCAITGITYQNRQDTIIYGTKYTLPSKLVREGYIFLGWFDENGTQITDGTWEFVTDKTLTAKWEEAPRYTVVFKNWDGTVISSKTYYYGDKVAAPTNPIREADEFCVYTFAGWDKQVVDCAGYATYTAQYAIGGFTGAYCQLTEDIEVKTTLTQDLYLDLNGYNISGSITTNGYKIYGIDSTTNRYTREAIGYFNCVDGNGDAVVPVTHFKSDITGSIKRYMAIQDHNGYSFHRFYLGITHQNLRPVTGGVGYKAVFYGDDMVAASLHSYGYTLAIGNHEPKTVTKAANSFISGKTVTLRIDNYDVEHYGETNLSACVMLKLNDGTVIESAQCAMTLRSMLEFLNINNTTLSIDQLNVIEEFVKKYAIIETWGVNNLLCKHTAVIIDAAVEPTCNATGLTEGAHCAICNRVLVSQNVINVIDHNYVDGNCQHCGANADLVELKKDLAVLKGRCLDIEAQLTYYSALISDHSSKCNYSGCMIEDIIYRFNSTYSSYNQFKYEINRIEENICNIESAEKIDIQRINQLKADLEALDYRFIGGAVIEADLAALGTKIGELNSHITSIG